MWSTGTRSCCCWTISRAGRGPDPAWHDFLARLDPRHGSSALLTLRPAAKHPLTDLAGVTHLRLERLAPGDALRLLADGLDPRSLLHKVETVAALSRGNDCAWKPWPGSPTSVGCRSRSWPRWMVGRAAGPHPYQLRLALAALAYNHNTWAGVGERLKRLARGREGKTAESLVGASRDDLAARPAPGAVELLQAMLVFPRWRQLRGAADGGWRETMKMWWPSTIGWPPPWTATCSEGTRQARYDLHPLTRSYLETRASARPCAPAGPSPPTHGALPSYANQHWAWTLTAWKPSFLIYVPGFSRFRPKRRTMILQLRDYTWALDKFFDGRSYWAKDLHSTY